MTKEQMETYDRHRSVVECRHIIAYLIFKLNGLSIARISPIDGNRHRTTVDHSIKTFEDLYETDPNFANRVKHVLIRLEGLCA
ncbi:helix-turn-helix domain-containing protein [Salmonella enterica]|uniref:helix-turn-helix domain-containing protein n=1 Tax=Salmonella enterica TaxID=28901 RepID=UPI00349F2266